MLKPLCIGNKTAQLPIIQGGMGVGVSRSSLAGAVAAEGGVGIISTAQIGYDEEGFEKDQAGCNLIALRKHIARAKEIAGGKGLIGVNVMTALKHYREHVKEAAAAGADVIICGAGLPVDLPELVEGSDAKIAPIVSSVRACNIILKMWDHKYQRTADFIVIEGPMAGGHLGFSLEQLTALGYIKDQAENKTVQSENTETTGATQTEQMLDMDEEIRGIISAIKVYEEKYGHPIPVVVGGGVFDSEDIKHVFELGADGVQIASRFVATYECDASEAYKQAYISATEKDVAIIKSPVGMPGRAVRNAFVKKMEQGREPIKKCYQCLEKCNPAKVPYCITKALVDAVKGDVENGLIFCGANVGRINEIMSVHDLMLQLQQ